MQATLGLWIPCQDLGQLSQISDRGKNVRERLLMTLTVEDGNVVSPQWAREWDGPLCLSISNMLVALKYDFMWQ
jgi:hypothetical protein